MERELFDKELIKSNLNKRKAKDKVLKIITIIATLVGVIFLLVLLIQIFSKGFKYLNWDFLTGFPSSRPERAGIAPAIVGSMYILV